MNETLFIKNLFKIDCLIIGAYLGNNRLLKTLMTIKN